MNLIIRFLAWCCHVIAATVPGKSGGGPPCIVEFVGVKSKPVVLAWNSRSAEVWILFATGHILAHCAHGKRRLAVPGIRSLSFARNRIPAHNEIKRGGK